MGERTKEMHPVKITVLKRLEMPWFKEYALKPEASGLHTEARGLGPLQTKCPLYREGQEFLVKDLTIFPEGFCAWAWADIQRNIAALALGGDNFWLNKPGIDIACCTDGMRPVVFKLERV